ncbi:MAG: NAD(P)H-hydrate epimerase [Actinobacteria bacterium]|nr:NAD(P)H-hydrate epimerase [Actinomycetota bacterium]
MKRLLSVTTEQMKEVDHIVIHEYGLQILQVMENAGRLLARVCRLMLGGRVSGRKIIVLAGRGRNAGGGLVAARNLHNWEADVEIALTAREDSLKRSALIQLNVLESMGLRIEDSSAFSQARLNKFDLIVDALIGYGIQGDPVGEFAHIISIANQLKKPIVSLDVPSGLDATTGRPYDPCIRASATVMLALPKTGLLEDQATGYVGELWLADIGIPPETYARIGIKGDNPFIDDDLVLLRHKKKAIGITA